MALTKLTRNSDRDRADVEYLATAVPLDATELRERYNGEMRGYVSVPEREDLTLNLWIEMIERDAVSPLTIFLPDSRTLSPHPTSFNSCHLLYCLGACAVAFTGTGISFHSRLSPTTAAKRRWGPC